MLRIIALCFILAWNASLLQGKTGHGEPVFSNAHIFHISVCEIDYNHKTKSFEISMKIFIDDLELALERDSDVTGLKIGTEKEHRKAEQHILKYLEKSFVLSTPDQVFSYDYIGKELSEDLIAIWCYFEVTEVEIPEILTIKNSVLTEVYDDQNNLINVNISKEKHGFLTLHRGQPSETINFND